MAPTNRLRSAASNLEHVTDEYIEGLQGSLGTNGRVLAALEAERRKERAADERAIRSARQRVPRCSPRKAGKPAS